MDGADNSLDRLAPRHRHSADARFLRYANGRIRQFWLRQVLTLLGATGIATTISLTLGGLTFAVAMAGELLDCAVLGLVLRSSASGRVSGAWKAIATGTACIQSATIAICVLVPIFDNTGLNTTFFSCAFLAAATINAGLTLPHFKSGAWARLGIFGASLCTVLGVQPTSDQNRILDLLAITALAISVVIFIRYVTRASSARRKSETDLIEQGLELARRIAELEHTRRELDTLALVARHANDSVILSDADGRILWVNEAFSRINGYSADEAVGQSPADLLNSPRASPQASFQIEAAKRQGRKLRIEVLNARKDGSDIWMETSIVPILSNDGTVQKIVAIERDVTAAKNLETELRAARHAAEEGARSKSQFLATISHEIRTPMNAVLGMSELLMDGELPPEERAYAQTIHESAGALLDIVNDVLDLSKLEAGKFTLANEVIDLRQTVMSAANLFRAAARQKDLHLNVSQHDELPEYVMGDAGRIRQILVNIIGNALKFTSHGQIDVTVRPIDEHDFIAFVIRDSGIGIAPDKLAKIFEEFSQAENGIDRSFGGTGLGLTISQQFARLMGGDINVSSIPGAGSTFTVTARLPKARKPSSATTPRTEVQIPTGLRVLLADDNSANRLLVRKFLDQLELDIIEACDGAQALNLLQDHSPDVILMDMQMPKIDGVAATRRIRDRPPPFQQPIIIALTASADAHDHARCLAAGMDYFLSKPIRKQALLDMLDRACTANMRAIVSGNANPAFGP